MPRAPRPGKRALYVEIDEAMFAELEALAASRERTIKGEVVLALRAHLESSRMPATPTDEQPKKPQKRKKP